MSFRRTQQVRSGCAKRRASARLKPGIIDSLFIGQCIPSNAIAMQVAASKPSPVLSSNAVMCKKKHLKFVQCAPKALWRAENFADVLAHYHIVGAWRSLRKPYGCASVCNNRFPRRRWRRLHGLGAGILCRAHSLFRFHSCGVSGGGLRDRHCKPSGARSDDRFRRKASGHHRAEIALASRIAFAPRIVFAPHAAFACASSRLTRERKAPR